MLWLIYQLVCVTLGRCRISLVPRLFVGLGTTRLVLYHIKAHFHFQWIFFYNQWLQNPLSALCSVMSLATMCLGDRYHLSHNKSGRADDTNLHFCSKINMLIYLGGWVTSSFTRTTLNRHCNIVTTPMYQELVNSAGTHPQTYLWTHPRLTSRYQTCELQIKQQKTYLFYYIPWTGWKTVFSVSGKSDSQYGRSCWGSGNKTSESLTRYVIPLHAN